MGLLGSLAKNFYFNGSGIPDDSPVYIRIFKEDLPAEVWEGYCAGLNVDTSDPSITSLVVYIDPYHAPVAERNEDKLKK